MSSIRNVNFCSVYVTYFLVNPSKLASPLQFNTSALLPSSLFLSAAAELDQGWTEPVLRPCPLGLVIIPFGERRERGEGTGRVLRDRLYCEPKKGRETEHG